MDRGDSSSGCRHQILSDFRELIPVSVTYLVAVHLRDLCHWEGSIINPMLDLKHGAEFSKVVVEEIRAGFDHIAGPDIFLRST